MQTEILNTEMKEGLTRCVPSSSVSPCDKRACCVCPLGQACLLTAHTHTHTFFFVDRKCEQITSVVNYYFFFYFLLIHFLNLKMYLAQKGKLRCYICYILFENKSCRNDLIKSVANPGDKWGKNIWLKLLYWRNSQVQTQYLALFLSLAHELGGFCAKPFLSSTINPAVVALQSSFTVHIHIKISYWKPLSSLGLTLKSLFDLLLQLHS